jgi:hypothetical protein
MIRISDLASTAAWSRPGAPVHQPRAENSNPASWFDDDAGADIRLSGTPALSARGLTVEQHAARVLAHLCGEKDAAL